MIDRWQLTNGLIVCPPCQKPAPKMKGSSLTKAISERSLGFSLSRTLEVHRV